MVALEVGDKLACTTLACGKITWKWKIAGVIDAQSDCYRVINMRGEEFDVVLSNFLVKKLGWFEGMFCWFPKKRADC